MMLLKQQGTYLICDSHTLNRIKVRHVIILIFFSLSENWVGVGGVQAF